MLINKDYKITWINPHTKQTFGNVEGKTCYEAIHGTHSICSVCGIKKIFDGANVDKRETTVESDGETRCFEITATPMKDQEGNVVAALELAVDITKTKRMQNELSKYSEKLEVLVEKRTALLKQAQEKLVKTERLAAIGELAGMVGHDLRNPLTGIKNSAYYLKKKGAQISEVQAKEMLNTIDRCVDYSNKIVSDLLDYSREIRLDLQECSLRKLLAEALDMMNMPEKVEILNDVPEELHLRVDSDKIKRVFINLVKNAIDAMPNGGKLTIAGKQVSDCSLELSFSDTGTGINEEIMPKLFSPLSTTKAQGMGFGLAICKRIIEAHGGKITVKTAKGKGTAFTIILPIESKPGIGGEEIWINMPKSSLSMMTKT
jgi:PAS domain S-box-containing protein